MRRHARVTSDQITRAIWQLLADARSSTMDEEETVEALLAFLRYSMAHHLSREERQIHTSHDDAMATYLAAIARASVLLGERHNGVERRGPKPGSE